MKGSIRQRSKGSFEVRVYLGRDLLTGKARYTSRTVRGGKREAQRVLAEMLTAADIGALGRVDTTVGHLLQQWFEYAQGDFSPATLTETRTHLDRTLLPGLGHLPLARLGPADLDRFYLQLRTNSGPDGEPLPAAAIQQVHTIIHLALGQAVRWEWLTANPADNASPPRVSTGEKATSSTLPRASTDEALTKWSHDTPSGGHQSRDEILARGRPFPPYRKLVIAGLTDEEEQAFLNAIADT